VIWQQVLVAVGDTQVFPSIVHFFPASGLVHYQSRDFPLAQQTISIGKTSGRLRTQSIVGMAAKHRPRYLCRTKKESAADPGGILNLWVLFG
jgi:hypothetical protein